MGSTALAEAPAIPQHMLALQQANDVRVKRGQLKRDLKERRKDLCEVLMDPPEYTATMEVGELLKTLPRVGDSRVSVLTRGICRPSLALGRIGTYTRSRLVERINETF